MFYILRGRSLQKNVRETYYNLIRWMRYFAQRALSRLMVLVITYILIASNKQKIIWPEYLVRPNVLY